jgi:hypothetical protein
LKIEPDAAVKFLEGAVTTFVDRIPEPTRPRLFDTKIAQGHEHSVALKGGFLEYVLVELIGFAIVPILVGSFHDLLRAKIMPIVMEAVGHLINSPGAAAVDRGRKVAYGGEIDQSGNGRVLVERPTVDQSTVEQFHGLVLSVLERSVANVREGWFQIGGRSGRPLASLRTGGDVQDSPNNRIRSGAADKVSPQTVDEGRT